MHTDTSVLFSDPSDHAGAPPQRLRHRPWPHLLRQGQDGLHDGLLCGHGFRGALWGILCSQVMCYTQLGMSDG